MLVQESPLHELASLDRLIAMASKKEQRTSQLALEALKDLFLHNLLPDRKLTPFRSNERLLDPKMSIKIGLICWYEDQLLKRVVKVVDVIETALKSTIEFFKKNCMSIASQMLMNKPEQEGRLLALLVNKLGDPSRAVCSKCIEVLRNVVYEVFLKSNSRTYNTFNNGF